MNGRVRVREVASFVIATDDVAVAAQNGTEEVQADVIAVDTTVGKVVSGESSLGSVSIEDA